MTWAAIRAWWAEFTTSKRTALLLASLEAKAALLDAENERLRDSLEALLLENAGLRKNNEALINTALCEAGKPSLPGSEVPKPPANVIRRLSPHQKQRNGIIKQAQIGLVQARYFANKAQEKVKAEGTNG